MIDRRGTEGIGYQGDTLGAPLTNLTAVLPRRDLISVRPDEVRLGSDRIEWKPNVLFQWQPGAPASDCLFNFLALADADDPAAFVQFARGHGVLGLTEDAVPAAFAERDYPRVTDDPEWRFERIADWKAHARNARTLMLLADAVKRGRRI